MNVRSYGSTALLVELDSPLQAAALRARLDARPPLGALESMPGLRTVLVRFDATVTDEQRLADDVAKLHAELRADGEPDGRLADDPGPAEVSVRVDYSGPDLAEVAEHTGMSVAAVIDAHQAASYQVVLIGMAPGFYFLGGGDPRLHVPRRASPRTDVPRGAVGLAGYFTGVYPRPSPGGWQLIGRVVDELWHPTRVPAALLAPGTPVRFTSAGQG